MGVWAVSEMWRGMADPRAGGVSAVSSFNTNPASLPMEKKTKQNGQWKPPCRAEADGRTVGHGPRKPGRIPTRSPAPTPPAEECGDDQRRRRRCNGS